MAQFSDLDHAFEGMSIQEAPITPTLERISTNHITGRIVCECSYSSSSSSSLKVLIGVDEDSAANNNWDQYASSHSTSPTSNWEVEHVNPPTDRVLVLISKPCLFPVIAKNKVNSHLRLPIMFIEPSKTLSSPKRRKALIADSDEDSVSTVSYPGTGRMTRSKQTIREQEKAEEEEKDRREAELDDNAKISGFVRKRPSRRSSSAQPSDTSSFHQSPSQEALNVENPADSTLAVPKTPLPESLETPAPQEFDKSVHDSIETFSSPVDTSTLEVDVQPSLKESSLLETHSSEATAHMVLEKTIPLEDATLDLNLNGSSSSHMASSSTTSFDVHIFSSKVKIFCDRICLPVQPPIVFNPVDELTVLLDLPTSCLKSNFPKKRSKNWLRFIRDLPYWISYL
ncbi:hypothetical protein RHGRI_001722 [Rhododendron griersonianum]|uniref:Uncharacterized protein n=1 Tax=Rhododendron griersonianum TaxID=479676 RepID=A0AAV6LL71_9ERIC|nr:hypothetical protein RHGRI_001722 [Rhododendron griersonianum]